MKKLLYLILGMITLSFSTLYADIIVENDNIWTETIIEANAPISFIFDITIPSDKIKERDVIILEPENFHSGSNKCYFLDYPQFEVISGGKIIGKELYFNKVGDKLEEIKLRISGRIGIYKGDWYSFNDGKIVIGRIENNGGNTGKKVEIYLTRDDLQIKTSIDVIIKEHLNLGKVVAPGILSHTATGGYPAKINIEVKGIANEQKNRKVKVELLDNKNIKLYGNGNELVAEVWFIDKQNSNKDHIIEKKLKLNNDKYETEDIEIGGSCNVPSNQNKGIYRGKARVRVTYVEE